MSVSLDLLIDNEIMPAALIRLALGYWKITYPDQVEPQQRFFDDGTSVAETRVEVGELDFRLAALQSCSRSREIGLETYGVDAKISLSVIIGRRYDDTPYGHLYLYLLNRISGDALITYNGESPLLLRKNSSILLEQGSGYFTREFFRSLLPGSVSEGKIPW